MLNAFFKRLGLRGIMSYVQITVLMCYFALEAYVLEYFIFLKTCNKIAKSLFHI